MSDLQLRVIQFHHPGFEYSGTKHLGPKNVGSGTMAWKRGDQKLAHNRKYLLARGAVLDPTTNTRRDDVEIGFWGEWEGPSDFTRIQPAEPYHPSALHRPFRPSPPPPSRQNTDPLVFGDRFLYSNCKQYRSAMKGLAPGSIILFGRGAKVHGEYCFSLDTCLVVDDDIQTVTIDLGEVSTFGESLISDMVIGPLVTEGATGLACTFYRGRRPGSDPSAPFSFVPVVLTEDRPEGFARPVLRPVGALAGMITETLRQGQRPNSLTDDAAARAVWAEVVSQVTSQGCLLGFHVQEPPIRADQ